MSEHTPTPWRVYEDDDCIVCFGEGDSICDCAPGSPFVKMGAAKANAAFICKAVNNHEALVKALSTLLEFAQTQGDFKNGVVHNCIDEGEVFASGVFDEARAALNAAVGNAGGAP